MPMSFDSQTYADGALKLAFEDGIAQLTLDRPGQRNAIGLASWRALPLAVRAVGERAGAKVLVVTGAAGDFAAGADIAEFDTVFADRAATLDYAEAMTDAMSALASLTLPSLALIEGHCIGAGVALALACDVRCASVEARFGVTPAKLGLLYSLGDTRRLVRAVGASTAADLLYTGRLFGAGEALSMRLVDELHEPARLRAAVSTKARLIASRSAWSVRHAKAVLALIDGGESRDTDATRAWFADAIEEGDYRERVQAFRGRRRGVDGL